MAYTISNTDGTTLVLLADSTVDRSTTSLDLIGRDVESYGQYINNNFVKLLENFSSTSGSPPRSPVTGQLWYDTTARKLKIYDNGFKSVSGATVATAQPTTLSSGDFWWDSVNNQLRLYNGSQTYVIGPVFPKSAGANGWVLPSATITDSLDIPQKVTLLRNYGEFIGAISTQTFDLSSSDALTYFGTTSTATIVSGLTIDGNIRVTGQITNNYLSTGININDMEHGTPYQSVNAYWKYLNQNGKISTLLESLFPVSPSNSYNDVGVPLGSEARIICQYVSPYFGTQVRRFHVVPNPVRWEPYEVYTHYFTDIRPSNVGIVTTGTTVTNIVVDIAS